MPVSEVAGVLKLVDRPDLGSGVERRVGSSPTTRTARDFPRNIKYQISNITTLKQLSKG